MVVKKMLAIANCCDYILPAYKQTNSVY